MIPSDWTQRARLHERAHDTALKLVTRYTPKLPDDVRTVVGYWQGLVLAGDRAAEQLLAYVRVQGIAEKLASPPRDRRGQ